MEAVKKVKTGVAGLDSLLLGGIPEREQVLVSGGPGTGKSLLGMQFVINGARLGEKGLFVSLDGGVDCVTAQARSLGLGLDEVMAKGKVIVSALSASDIYKMINEIEELVKKNGVTRLVLDSISTAAVYASSYRNLPEDLLAFLEESHNVPLLVLGESVQRQMIYYVVEKIRALGCTAILTSELPKTSEWYSRDTVSEFACDGIIFLDQQILGEDNLVRTLAVVKMRGSDYRKGVYEFDIRPKEGIAIKVKELK